jgi:hypothetical protein
MYPRSVKKKAYWYLRVDDSLAAAVGCPSEVTARNTCYEKLVVITIMQVDCQIQKLYATCPMLKIWTLEKSTVTIFQNL